MCIRDRGPAGGNVTRNLYKASKVVINQGLEDEDFTFDFPPGTLVDDEIAGVQYRVRPVSRQFDRWIEKNDDLLKQVDGAQEAELEEGGTLGPEDSSHAPGISSDSHDDLPVEADGHSQDMLATSTPRRSHILVAVVVAVSVLLVVAVVTGRIFLRG